jgi:hypothetical protein
MWQLAETTSEGWRPGIGDPSVMGWVTVAAYFCAAVLCLFSARRAMGLRTARHDASPLFWFGLAALFVALGINKQLDLQSWFTSVGREMARNGGWYEQRRTVQMIFIIALASTGVIAIAWLLWRIRRSWRSHGLAVLGTIFLIVFIIIRAGSFHHFDEMLGWSLVGVRMNWLLELSGIACVALGAAMFLLATPAGRGRSETGSRKMQ